MLSCKEVTQKIASDRLARAGRWERLSVRFHLLMCRYCRGYAAQLRAVGEAVRELWGPLSEDPDRLKRLEHSILEDISGGPGADSKTARKPKT